MKRCAHCNAEILGDYCSSCGQKVLDTPFTYKDVVTLSSDVFEFGTKFFKTLIKLLVKPSQVVNRYLKGDTKSFVSPLKFLVLIIGLLVLLTNEFSDKLESYAITIVMSIMFWLFNMILFKKESKKPVEHFLIVLYESAFMMVLIYFSYLLGKLIPEIPAADDSLSDEVFDSENAAILIWFGFMFLYHIWFSMNVFQGKKGIILLKSILSYFIMFLLGITLIFLFSDGVL